MGEDQRGSVTVEYTLILVLVTLVWSRQLGAPLIAMFGRPLRLAVAVPAKIKERAIPAG